MTRCTLYRSKKFVSQSTLLIISIDPIWTAWSDTTDSSWVVSYSSHFIFILFNTSLSIIEQCFVQLSSEWFIKLSSHLESNWTVWMAPTFQESDPRIRRTGELNRIVWRRMDKSRLVETLLLSVWWAHYLRGSFTMQQVENPSVLVFREVN